jgi:hypothetical protein
MAAQDLLDALIADLGAAQPERDDPRLDPVHAPLDDRDTTALLAGARALAARLRHYPLKAGEPIGDWSAYFPAGSREALAELVARDDGRVPPHLALLIAFLKLAARPQALLNGFAGAHLQFQMQRALGFRPRPPLPDRAHLVLELKKGATTVPVDESHVFSAGKDLAKVEQLFRPVRRALVGRARVQRLVTIARSGDDLRFAPVADSADGLGAPLASTEPRWPPFGRPGLPSAPVGFAVASATLRLAEGERQVQLVLRLAGLEAGIDAAALAASFEAHVSVPEGWSGPWPLSGSAAAGTVTLSFSLPADAPPLVDHDPAVHGQPFPAGLPVVQLLLRDGGPLRYAALSGLTLRSAQVVVRVTGVRGLVLENDQSALDPKKAFLPFGAQPVLGARFFIGCPEALAKRLTALSVRLVWQGAPADLEAWYAGYAGAWRLRDGVSATLGWQDASGVPRSTPPVTLLPRYAAATTLSIDAPGLAAPVRGLQALTLQSGGLAGLLQLQRERFRRPSLGAAQTAARTAGPTTAPTAAPRAGFVTVTLQEDLLHGEFRRASMTAATASTPGIVNEPYTPKVQDITLDYGAQSDQSGIDDPALASLTDTDLQFFHVDALGVAREHRWLATQRPWSAQGGVTLLPSHTAAGELLIGIDGLAGAAAGQELSLLLQVAEGSADPEAPAQTLQWSVLADNAWRTLGPGELVLDTTRALRSSGLVTVVLPRETSTEHTLAPAGLVWLRATVPAAPRAACDLVGVHANAIEVQFADQGNDPARLASPLPAGSLTKLKTAVAAIKSVAQPYASFGGALIEDDTALARRAAERLRHRNRALTGWDWERLVLQEFPQVYRAKCIPHASASSWLAAGHVMLVVVPDLRNRNAVDPLQPRVDLDTLERIREFVSARCGMQLRFTVRNPRYRAVQLDFKVRLRAGFGFAFYGAELNRALQQALSPWAFDSGAQLGFGGRIVRSELLDYVESLPYVDFVTDFHLAREGVAEDRAEIAPDAPDVILVSAAQHRIVELVDG